MSEIVKERIESLPHGPSMGQAARLLTLEDVAGYLAVSRALVKEVVADGSLRVLRIGGEVRVRPEELEAFLRRAST